MPQYEQVRQLPQLPDVEQMSLSGAVSTSPAATAPTWAVSAATAPAATSPAETAPAATAPAATARYRVIGTSDTKMSLLSASQKRDMVVRMLENEQNRAEAKTNNAPTLLGRMMSKVRMAIQHRHARVNLFEYDIGASTDATASAAASSQKITIVYIVGTNDNRLIQLANGEYDSAGTLRPVPARDTISFPRGFCLFFLTTTTGADVEHQYITRACFLPKFNNDDHRDLEQSELNSGDQLRVSKKLSGSLGMMTAFDVETVTGLQNFVFFGSKNGTGNVYSQKLHDLMITNPNFDLMCDELSMKKLCINFEVCSEQIGTHGSTYYSEHAVALVVGGVGQQTQIYSPLSEDDSRASFGRWELDVESRWILTGDAKREFVKSIVTDRALMTNKSFDTMMRRIAQKMGGECRTFEGSFSHASLSNVLEGVIVHIYNRGEKIATIKFKFPRYTVNTFLFRNKLLGGEWDNIKTRIRSPIVRTGVRIDRAAVFDHAQQYVARWVPSEYREKYKQMAGYVAYMLERQTSTAPSTNYLTHYIEPLTRSFLKHIIYADQSVYAEYETHDEKDVVGFDYNVFAEIRRDAESYRDHVTMCEIRTSERLHSGSFASDAKPMPSQSKRVVNIIAIGAVPPGAGKSTMFAKIAKLVNKTGFDYGTYSADKNPKVKNDGTPNDPDGYCASEFDRILKESGQNNVIIGFDKNVPVIEHLVKTLKSIKAKLDSAKSAKTAKTAKAALSTESTDSANAANASIAAPTQSLVFRVYMILPHLEDPHGASDEVSIAAFVNAAQDNVRKRNGLAEAMLKSEQPCALTDTAYARAEENINKAFYDHLPDTISGKVFQRYIVENPLLADSEISFGGYVKIDFLGMLSGNETGGESGGDESDHVATLIQHIMNTSNRPSPELFCYNPYLANASHSHASHKSEVSDTALKPDLKPDLKLDSKYEGPVLMKQYYKLFIPQNQTDSILDQMRAHMMAHMMAYRADPLSDPKTVNHASHLTLVYSGGAYPTDYVTERISYHGLKSADSVAVDSVETYTITVRNIWVNDYYLVLDIDRIESADVKGVLGSEVTDAVRRLKAEFGQSRPHITVFCNYNASASESYAIIDSPTATKYVLEQPLRITGCTIIEHK